MGKGILPCVGLVAEPRTELLMESVVEVLVGLELGAGI